MKYPDIYTVEKVLRKRGNQGYVKWIGFDDSHKCWIDESRVKLSETSHQKSNSRFSWIFLRIFKGFYMQNRTPKHFFKILIIQKVINKLIFRLLFFINSIFRKRFHEIEQNFGRLLLTSYRIE